MTDAATPLAERFPSFPPRVAIFGARGYNAQHRVLPSAAKHPLDLRGYDLADGPARIHGFPVETVRDNQDLLERLRQQRPDVVLIETPDDQHAEHVRLALRAGVRRIVCEKCAGYTTAEGEQALDWSRQAAPGQQVDYLDHYLGYHLVRLLRANTSEWLGQVKQVRVTLLEAQGVPPHQEKSHANGMGNFLHHVLALGALWFDLDDLLPGAATWARHPEANVPDTYRQVEFSSARGGQPVLRGAVGKYAPRPIKQIHLTGTAGEALLDRDRNVLAVRCQDGRSFAIPGPRGDNGYGSLFRALAAGDALPSLMPPVQAVQALRLIEQAHARARKVPHNERSDDLPFVCEWGLPLNHAADQPVLTAAHS